MELLVVMTIIVILAAMLMPALQKARDQAKRVVCVSNLRQIVMSYLMYAQDHGGTIPVHGNTLRGTWYLDFDVRDGEDHDDDWGGAVNTGTLLYHGYLNDPRILYCPAVNRDSSEVHGCGASKFRTVYGKLYGCQEYRAWSPTPGYFYWDGNYGTVQGSYSQRYVYYWGNSNNLFHSSNSRMMLVADNSATHHLGRVVNVGYVDGSVQAYIDSGGLIGSDSGYQAYTFDANRGK